MTLLIAVLAALSFQTPPPGAADLTNVVAGRDAELFRLMFDACDPDALADLISEDLEFYHDRSGAMMGRAAFIADYRQSCEARTPDGWRSRRELVSGTLVVHPIPGVGAVAEGTHQFLERRGDGPERLTGHARFSVLWRQEPDGELRLARAFSIAHEATH